MTDSTRAALEGFSEVWARVRGEGGEAEGSGSELEVLREFIADESCAAAFYEAAARRFGRFSSRLRAIACEERRHLRALQAEHFLLTGEICLPPASCPLPCGGLRILRTAWLDERSAAEAYLKAADTASSASLAAVYRCNAADEERHSEILREIILCAL